ncbi:MAG TPA: SDR family NAD(P)-dependent oxidoreductase [Syntrophales bacterium]|nr:SDR family NAD(P)-dependent oxidoreductase [Syntrophales bacterium]
MNKTVFITGTSRGFGYALVEQFLTQGWMVYCLVRNDEDANKMVQMNSSRCIPIISDVTSDNLQSDIASSLSSSTTIDVLINNAGAGSCAKPFTETLVNDVRKLLDIHCLGALRVTQAIIPYINNDGVIINISSRFGSITKTASGELDNISCSYSYRIAKAAQNMFSLCLSREYKNRTIKVCSIHPGKLKTASASPDADREPREAAETLLSLLSKIENGKFYSLFEGEFDW